MNTMHHLRVAPLLVASTFVQWLLLLPLLTQSVNGYANNGSSIALSSLQLTCPPAISISCDSPTSPAITGFAQATTDCGEVTVSFLDNFAATCGSSGIITRTWTATDNCGETISCEQQITVFDNTPPVISYHQAPGSVVEVECNLADDDWSAFSAITAALVLEDDCGNANIDLELHHELVEEGICGVSDFLSIWHCTWTATDPCGNRSEYDLFVRIVDSEGPIWIDFPADITISCGEAIPMQPPTASDNCSAVTDIHFSDELTDQDCAHSYMIRREWRAIDGCGNDTKEIQHITVVDQTPPDIYFADGYINGYEDGQDVFINCRDYGRITQLGFAALAFDACSGQVDVQFDYEDFGQFNCAAFGYSGQVRTSWTATDECGNTRVASLNWFLVDDTPPRLQGVPEDQCVSTLPPAPYVTGVDDCDFVLVNMTTSDPITCDGGTYVIRTWTATDACGNSDSATQRLYLNDGTAPAISIDYPNLIDLPSGSTAFIPAECNAMDNIVAPDILAAVSTTDGCSEVRVEKALELISNGGCVADGFLARYQLQVQATDLCGNESRYELFIHLIDATVPTIEAPSELIMGCGEAIPLATAFDECGEVTELFFIGPEEFPVNCPANPQFSDRFWLAIDACGNTNVFEQRIAIVDNTGPVFTQVPANACGTPNDSEEVVAFDECSGLQVNATLSESTHSLPDCGEVLLRTWTAVDSCGNESTASQQIVLADDQAPSLSFDHPLLQGLADGDVLTIPVGFVYGSPEEPFDFGTAAILASDNCGTAIDILYRTETIAQEGCLQTGYLSQHKVEWIASDPCGNASSLSILLAYTDAEAPEIREVPHHLTLHCNDIIPDAEDVWARDNYDLAPDFTFEEIISETSYGQRIIRIWTATDECGNFSEARQRIDVYANDLEASFDHPAIVNCNTSENTIAVTVSGGNAPYSYQWQMIDCDGFITSDPSRESIQYTLGYTTQNFQVTITDANGCVYVTETSIACVNDDVSPPGEGIPGGSVPGEVATEVALYPNPAHEFITIYAPTLVEESVEIWVYNILGQAVYQEKTQNWPEASWQIDARNLVAGSYWVHLLVPNQAPIIREVVVQE